MAVKEPRSKTAPARTMTCFRLSQDELAQISEQAKIHGMTRTAYILAAALGKLDSRNDALSRLEDVENRVQRLEQLVFDGQ